jgi:hypothetical protein
MKLFNFFNKNKQKATDFPSENNLSDLPNYDYRFGEFNINDIPEQYKNNKFLFHKYIRNDGEWIDEGEKICVVKIIENNSYRYQGITYHAEKSGFLEWILNIDDEINDKVLLYKIHSIGEYNSENSVHNDNYKHYFYTDEPQQHLFKKWFVNDGDFVNKDDKIYEFSTSIFKNDNAVHFAEKSGFIDIVFSNTTLQKNELIYFIREDDTKRQDRKFINIHNVISDEFNGSKSIEWEKVSSKADKSKGIVIKSDDDMFDFMFTFNYLNNNDFIVFNFNPKNIKIKENDKIFFLFENEKTIEFAVTNSPIITKNYKNENIIEIKKVIILEELELFANVNLKKWKIYLKSEEKSVLGGSKGSDLNYLSKKDLNIVIKKFTNDYLNIVKNTITNYKPLINRNLDNIKVDSKVIEACYVYLMLDTSNGYYKIGISNNPVYREKTLQSEKPTIEVVISKKFPIRKIAESFEKSLHITYAEKRIRGEWFILDEIDVTHIVDSLK